MVYICIFCVLEVVGRIGREFKVSLGRIVRFYFRGREKLGKRRF